MKKILSFLLLMIMSLGILSSCNGAEGPQEEQGIQGVQGEAGPQGQPGKDGTSVLTGNGEPSNELGVIGDSYIDLDTWNFYVKKETGWVLTGNIKGESANADHDGTEGLEFYPINDAECAVSVGNALLLENIVIPSVYKTYKVTQIIYNGFENCSNLKNITIPATIKKIGASAFKGCSNLENLYYKGTIEDFCNVVGDGTDIYSNPMSYAENFYMLNENNEWYEVNEIEIPDTITSINDGQLYSFENVNKLTLSSSVKSIGFNVFSGWSSLESVYYKGTVEDWCSISFANQDSNPKTYAENLYMLDENNEWYEVSEINIPDTINEIKQYQFYNFEKLTSVKIPDSITQIGKNAFYNCLNLTKVEIPNSVTYIGKGAFYYCNALEYIAIPFVGEKLDGSGQTHFGHIFEAQYISGSNEFVPQSLKEVIITGGTSISSGAFYNCDSLISIEIPNSVTSVFGAFSNFDNLKYNEYQNGLYLGNKENPYLILAAVKDTTISTFEFHSMVKFIADEALSSCVNLINLEIPDGVVSIGNYAFSNCSSLTSIEIPESVTSIGYRAFSSCSSLKSIEIPEGVTSIGYGTFEYCRSLTSIVIPKSVTSIGEDAFLECGKLQSIVIPEGVTSIGSYAFFGCSSLTIHCEAESEPSGWESRWNHSNIPVYWAGEWEYDANGNPVPLS